MRGAKPQTAARAGCSGGTDVPTDRVHRGLMEGRRRGDTRLSAWLAVLARRLGACTVQDRQAEATGTVGVGFVTSSLCLKQVDGGLGRLTA